VDTKLRLPSKTPLEGMQTGMQFELYECLGQARHQMWVGLATFARTTFLNNT